MIDPIAGFDGLAMVHRPGVTRAAVICSLLNTFGHSLNVRLVVTMIDVDSILGTNW